MRTTLAGAAIPYGYTLVVWSSGSLVAERDGRPDVWDVVLFAAGASAAYALLQISVRGSKIHHRKSIGEHGIFETAAVQASAIAIALAAAAAISLLGDTLAWVLAPFAATIAYLSGIAISQANEITKEGGDRA